MKKLGRFFLVLFLIILIFIVAVPVAYLSLAGFDWNDTQSPDFYQPLSVEERFTFSSATDSMDIKLTNADIIWYVEDDLYAAVDEKLSPFGLSLNRIGLQIKEDGLFASAQLKYKKILPIPVGCLLTLRQAGSKLEVSVDSVHLGRWITVNSEWLESISGYDMSDLTFNFDLDSHPFFNLSRSVTLEEEALVFHCSFPSEWLLNVTPLISSDFTIMLDYVHPEDISPDFPILLAYCDGDSTLLNEKLASFAKDPASFEKFKMNILNISGTYAANLFFNESEWNGRFFPGITRETVQTGRTSILDAGQSIYDARMEQISSMEMEALALVADGTMKVNGSNYSVNGKEFTLDYLPSAAGLEEWMDVSSLRMIQAENPGDYLQNMVGNRKKVPVLIGRTYTDRPVVFFQYTSKQFRVQSLSEKEYLRYMSSYNVPTVDLGMTTTK